jgi:uncharacterized protein
MIAGDDPLAADATRAVRTGDVESLARLLDEHPGLGGAFFGDSDGTARSLLHVATDWPGHFPNNAATVRTLIAAGADVDARFIGPHEETPLHWAASSNDIEVLDALLDAGADIEAQGAVIAGGTALDDATAFGQWAAARRLVERGAQATLFQAASLGLDARVRAFVDGEPPPTPGELDGALWSACHGGQLETARYLHACGANPNWIPPWEPRTALDMAIASRDDGVESWREVADWLTSVGGRTGVV